MINSMTNRTRDPWIWVTDMGRTKTSIENHQRKVVKKRRQILQRKLRTCSKMYRGMTPRKWRTRRDKTRARRPTWLVMLKDNLILKNRNRSQVKGAVLLSMVEVRKMEMML